MRSESTCNKGRGRESNGLKEGSALFFDAFSPHEVYARSDCDVSSKSQIFIENLSNYY